MRSPKSEAPPVTSRLLAGTLQRLNVRLVLILASVALVALVVSGIAISQILPGYFIDQAERRAETAANATLILARNQAELLARQSPSVLLTPELRNTQLLQPVAQVAANRLAQGTVEITYVDGTRAAVAAPDPEFDASLRDQGLQPDAGVHAQSVPDDAFPIAPGQSITLIYTVRDVYTNRVATLQRVNGTLVGAG